MLKLTKYVLLKASWEQSASLSLSVGEGLSGFPGLSPIPADKLTTMCNCSEEGHPPGIKPHNSPNDRNCKTKILSFLYSSYILWQKRKTLNDNNIKTLIIK